MRKAAMLGLRIVVYKLDAFVKAKDWYTKALGIKSISMSYSILVLVLEIIN